MEHVLGRGSETISGATPIDATRISRGLYQGGRPPFGPHVRAAGFDVLVLCAREIQPGPEMFPGVGLIHAPLDDADVTMPELLIARDAARGAADARRQGKRVLVTCRMGRNRSGLVTAMTLRLLTGRPGAEIVKHIQGKRPGALTNEKFVRALESLS